MFFVSKIILQNVASCYAFYKDYSKASVYFKKLVDLQPDNEGGIADYGRVLAMSGKVDEAKEQLRNALKIAETKNQEQFVEQVYFFLVLNQLQKLKSCHKIPKNRSFGWRKSMPLPRTLLAACRRAFKHENTYCNYF